MGTDSAANEPLRGALWRAVSIVWAIVMLVAGLMVLLALLYVAVVMLTLATEREAAAAAGRAVLAGREVSSARVGI